MFKKYFLINIAFLVFSAFSTSFAEDGSESASVPRDENSNLVLAAVDVNPIEALNATQEEYSANLDSLECDLEDINLDDILKAETESDINEGYGWKLKWLGFQIIVEDAVNNPAESISEHKLFYGSIASVATLATLLLIIKHYRK